MKLSRRTEFFVGQFADPVCSRCRNPRGWNRRKSDLPATAPNDRIWLVLAVRDAIPKARDLAKAEFATLHLKLIKIAARVVEMANRVRLAFAAAFPEADLLAYVPAALMPRGP